MREYVLGILTYRSMENGENMGCEIGISGDFTVMNRFSVDPWFYKRTQVGGGFEKNNANKNVSYLEM